MVAENDDREKDDHFDDAPEDDTSPVEKEEEPHYKRRTEELETHMGRRAQRGYLLWVVLWVVVLAVALIAYAFLTRTGF